VCEVHVSCSVEHAFAYFRLFDLWKGSSSLVVLSLGIHSLDLDDVHSNWEFPDLVEVYGGVEFLVLG
jgi:hypothetical protein